jgi:hypothetical protein
MRLRWVGHEFSTREMRNGYRILVRKCKEKYTWGTLGVHGKKIAGRALK